MQNKIFPLFLALCAVLLAYPIETVESLAGVKIIWHAPKLDSTFIDNGFLLIEADGAEILGAFGSPAIPVYRVPVVIPSDNRWSFSINNEIWEPIGKANLAPVATWRGYPDGPFFPEYILDEATYAQNRWFPDNIEFSETGFIRNIRLGHLEIPTIRYNPFTKELERLSAMTCELEYGLPMSLERGTPLDRIERTAVNIAVNPQSANSLARERPRQRPSAGILSSEESWFTFPVSSSGLVKIDRAYIASLGYNPSAVDPSEIRVFDVGWRELPVNMEPDLPELQEIPLYPVGLGDGSFDDGDALIFYARGPAGVIITDRGITHHMHRFAKENYYWITIGGDFTAPAKRIAPEVIPHADTVRTGRSLHFVEHDNIDAKTNNDIQWGSERTTFKQISWIDSRIDTTQGVYVRHYLIPVAEETRPIVYSRANGRSPDSTMTNWTGAQQSFFMNTFTKGVNSIEINFQGASALLDYYQILYWMELEQNNGALQFIGSDSSATYVISGWGAQPVVFDITEQTSLRMLTVTDIGGGRYAFSDSLGGRQYFASTTSTAARALPPSRRNLVNLRERVFNSDLLMLIPSGLENDLDRYISYREGRGISVEWVFVEDVMQEFGFGMNDPTAIRDFLRYIWLSSEDPPEFIMLVGDATWDPKGITNPPPTYCPAALCVANASDDYFYSVTYGDAVPDYAGGRVPINTINDWRHFVDKVIRTEGEPEFGPWRTRFVYCADDDRRTGDNPDTWAHTTQTSSLIRTMPGWTEPRSIYVVDYPMTSLGLKPSAQKDLLDYWNDGSQLMNYVGHGNYRLWTHEEVFEATSCVGKLNNKWKLPLMVSASCEVGLFYRIIGQSIAEQVLLRPESGAVASIAATRMTLANYNGVLNERLLYACWGQNRKERLGIANLYAKGGNTWSSTQGQYVLFGDPSMEIGPPELDIAIRVEPDSLLAGRKVSVSGEILADSSIIEDFNGTVHLLVYDSGFFKTTYSKYLLSSATYYEGGNRIFNGPADVINGRFEAEFLVPIDVSYDTDAGKVVAYAYNESQEAVGYLSNMAVSGDTSLVIADSTGPEVSISFEGEGFADGGIICNGGTLLVSVSDESGVNLSGSAGHMLTMTLNGNEASAIDLSPFFEYDRNSYQSGIARYPLENLPVGMHTIRVKAWDNVGNSGTSELFFEVADCEVALSNLLAYPNPFSTGTEITFNIGSVADVKVSIFTTTGKPVRRLESSVTPAFASIYWDGNDSHGTPVANGAYIVKIEARTEDGEATDKVFKIAKLR